MRIAIMGAGAIGSLFGGYIARNTDHSIHLIGRPAHVSAIKERGLQLEGLTETIQVKNLNACAKADEVGGVDLVILTVKAPDTRQALLDSSSLFSDETHLMCLQNGLGVEEVALEVIEDNTRILRGTTTNGALFIQPGLVRHTGQGETIIGSALNERIQVLDQIREIFDRSGFPTTISSDIQTVIWKKIMVNVGINALGALTRLQNGLLPQNGLRDVIKELVQEAVKVARASGIGLAEEDSMAKTLEVCQKTFKNKNSMLQDILKGKRTEIDYINGAIVRHGEKLHVPTPLNQVVTALIKGLEKSNE